MNVYKPLKRILICEEHVAITGNFIDAAILNYMIECTDLAHDFDKIVSDATKHETLRSAAYPEKSNGWFRKSANEISEETMLGMSHSSIMKHVKKLVSLGFIEERSNPNSKLDKAKQYRVNTNNIADAVYSFIELRT